MMVLLTSGIPTNPTLAHHEFAKLRSAYFNIKRHPGFFATKRVIR